MDTDPAPPALIRRFAAIGYDTLLLSGVLFLAGLPLPLIPDAVRENWGVQLTIQAYLILICLLFFGWFWTHGGQTLGMRAWRLKVVAADGSPVGWRSAVTRYFCAILSWVALGLGFWWSLVDRERLTWHDRLSRTRLIRLKKTDRKQRGPGDGVH